MTVPEQLNRWIRASVVKYFHTPLSAIGHTYVEGQERETENEKEWFEIRLDGPLTKKLTSTQYRIRIDINILVAVLQDSSSPIYRINDLGGKIENLFGNCIEVKRYGDVADDSANDSSLVGTLTLRPQGDEEVETTYFGKVQPDTALEMLTVEGHYEGYWSF